MAMRRSKRVLSYTPFTSLDPQIVFTQDKGHRNPTPQRYMSERSLEYTASWKWLLHQNAELHYTRHAPGNIISSAYDQTNVHLFKHHAPVFSPRVHARRESPVDTIRSSLDDVDRQLAAAATANCTPGVVTPPRPATPPPGVNVFAPFYLYYRCRKARLFVPQDVVIRLIGLCRYIDMWPRPVVTEKLNAEHVRLSRMRAPQARPTAADAVQYDDDSFGTVEDDPAVVAANLDADVAGDGDGASGEAGGSGDGSGIGGGRVGAGTKKVASTRPGVRAVVGANGEVVGLEPAAKGVAYDQHYTATGGAPWRSPHDVVVSGSAHAGWQPTEADDDFFVYCWTRTRDEETWKLPPNVRLMDGRDYSLPPADAGWKTEVDPRRGARAGARGGDAWERAAEATVRPYDIHPGDAAVLHLWHDVTETFRQVPSPAIFGALVDHYATTGNLPLCGMAIVQYERYGNGCYLTAEARADAHLPRPVAEGAVVAQSDGGHYGAMRRLFEGACGAYEGSVTAILTTARQREDGRFISPDAVSGQDAAAVAASSADGGADAIAAAQASGNVAHLVGKVNDLPSLASMKRLDVRARNVYDPTELDSFSWRKHSLAVLQKMNVTSVTSSHRYEDLVTRQKRQSIAAMEPQYAMRREAKWQRLSHSTREQMNMRRGQDLRIRDELTTALDQFRSRAHTIEETNWGAARPVALDREPVGGLHASTPTRFVPGAWGLTNARQYHNARDTSNRDRPYLYVGQSSTKYENIDD